LPEKKLKRNIYLFDDGLIVYISVTDMKTIIGLDILLKKYIKKRAL
jgi:hypothetical protein